jgi:hypothetical protein
MRYGFAQPALSLPKTNCLGVKTDHRYSIALSLAYRSTAGFSDRLSKPSLPRYRIRLLEEDSRKVAICREWKRLSSPLATYT